MDRKDLIFMASEAGFGKLLTGDGLPTMWHGTDLGMLERFAGLVATAEREACAKLCDEESELANMQANNGGRALDDGRAIGAEACAEAIRVRSNDQHNRPASAGPG